MDHITIKEFCQISENNPALFQARTESTHHITEKRFAFYKNIANDRYLIYICDPNQKAPKIPIKEPCYNTWYKIKNSFRGQITPGKMEQFINLIDTHNHHYIIIFDGVIIWE